MIDYDTVSFLKNLFSGVPDVAVSEPVEVPPPSRKLEWLETDEDIAFRSCRTCGRSDLWETISGVWRCQHCDSAALAQSRSLAEKAALLREQLLQRP